MDSSVRTLLLSSSVVVAASFAIRSSNAVSPPKIFRKLALAELYSPYHSLIFCQNYQRTVFANDRQLMFCDEICDDYGQYNKVHADFGQLTAFQEGVLFTDGPTLMYNSLQMEQGRDPNASDGDFEQ